jgi:hypothetical protein
VLGLVLDAVTRELLGLECRARSSSLRLLSGEVVFEGLELSRPGGGTIVSAGRVEASIAWIELPSIVVHRALVEDLRVSLRREVDGTIPALADIVRLATAPGDPAARKSRTTPRVLLETVRVNHASLAWEDASKTPIVRESVELDLRADDVATFDWPRPAFASVRLAAPGILDSCRIDVAAHPFTETARVFELSLSLEGHPGPLAPYLGKHARPDARSLQLDLEARFVARPILLEGNGSYAGDLTVEHVSLRADEDEVGFDRLVASVRRIGPDGIELTSVSCDRPRARLARLADGSLAFSGFAFPPHEDGPEAGRSGAPPSSILPRVAVDEVAIHGGRFRFQDATTATPIDLGARDLEVHVLGLAHDPTHASRPARLEASVSVANAADSIALVGTLVPFGPRRSASLDLTARGLTLAAIEPYLAKAGLSNDLASGKLAAHLELSATSSDAPGGDGRVTLDGTLSNLVLEDRTERLGIGSIAVAGARLDLARGALDVGSIEIAKPRARLRRDPHGTLSGVGVRFRPGPAAPGPAATAARPSRLQHVTVGRVAVSEAALTWHDEAPGEPVELGIADGAVTLTGIAYDASGTGAAAREPARLTARARLTPDVGQLSLDASVVADPAAPSFSGTLAVTALTPRPLASYLAAFGIDPLVEKATLEAHVAAAARVESFALRDLRVQLASVRLVAPGPDATPVELAAIDRLEVVGADLDARARSVHVGDVTVEGIRGSVLREASGGIVALGLRFREKVDAGDAEAKEPAPEPAPVPRIQWGEVAVRGAALSWRDERVEPHAAIRVTRLDASLGALAFDHGDQGGSPPLERPAPFRLHVAIEGAVGALDLAGGVVPSARAPAIFASVQATGLTLGAFAPYLGGAGLVPGLASGELAAHVEGAAQIARGSVDATFLVKDLSARDRALELAGIDLASFGLHCDRVAGTVELTPAVLRGPRLVVRREASGDLALAGLTLRRRSGGAPVASPPKSAADSILLRGVSVQGLALGWRDELDQVSLDLARGTIELGEARIGAGAAPARLKVEAAVLDVGSLALEGVVKLDGAAPAVSGTIALSHVRGAKLTPYLHGRGALLLEDGTLGARLAGSLGSSPEGGRTVSAAIEDLCLEERGRRILSFGSLRAEASRLDPAANAYVIDELSLGGLEGEAETLAGGAIRVAGVELLPRPAAAPAPDATNAPADEAATDEPMPSLVVRSISAAATRFAVYDWASLAKPPRDPADGPPPFVFEDVRLVQFRPFVLASDPTTAMFLGGTSMTIAGVASRVIGSLQLFPFDSEPRAALVVELGGVSGPGLLQRAPELAARLDLSAIQQGSLRATVTLDLRSRRRIDALLRDLEAQPLAFELNVSDVEARSSPDGPVLLGCDELHVDVASLDLGTGAARIRAIELTNPRGRVRREPGGVRILDALVRPAPPAAAVPVTEARRAAEVRIDRIALLDGDVLLEDATVSPEASLQLGALEVELTDASSRALEEKRPFRFRVGARGGTFFDEFTARGVLELHPFIDGQIDATISGTKGNRLTGYTKDAWKLDVKDGRLDLDFRATFREGRMKSLSRLVLTEVQTEEPPGSMIQREAGISLQTAIASLRDDDQVVVLSNIPVDIDFDEHGHATGASVGVTVGKALGLTVKGALSGLLTPFEELGQSFKKAMVGRDDDEALHPHRVEFAAADAQLPAAASADLDVLAAKLKADSRLRASLRAEVAAADLARAQKLNAPTPGERRDLIARLEARRTKVERVRADAEADVRAALLAGSDALGAARARYTQAARSVQEVDRTLDGLYDQEREGRARSGERRASEVMESICDARVEAIRSYLVRQGVPIEQVRALRSRLRAGAEAEGPGRVQIDVSSAAAR